MEAKRWTLGVVLAVAVSLFGLIQADASPFSTYILTDDLGNRVNGAAAEQSEWDEESSASSADDGSSNDGASDDGADTAKDNNGHGNNADGVDSSNKGNSKQGEDTVCADGTYCDDEAGGGTSSSSDSGSSSSSSNNGKGKGKKK